MKSILAINSQLSYADYSAVEFRQLLDQHGYVYMQGVPEDFDHETFLRGFGEFMPQYDGEKVWSVIPQERFENMYHSLNRQALHPHTECYEFPGVSPQYLALWGITPARDGGGQTTLADTRGFLATLTEEELRELAARRYEFVSADGVLDMQLGRTATHPLYELRDGREPIFRFSYNNVKLTDDPFLHDMRQRVVSYFAEQHVAVGIETGAILIWNNHRVLHSRTAFTDMRRHLRRVWLAEAV
jgi:hypothetical protein